MGIQTVVLGGDWLDITDRVEDADWVQNAGNTPVYLAESSYEPTGRDFAVLNPRQFLTYNNPSGALKTWVRGPATLSFQASYDPLGFDADDLPIADIAATLNSAITDTVLTAAEGGSGSLAYSVEGLPAGLTFTAATRTVSGTPTEGVGTVFCDYTVTDAVDNSVTVPFSVVYS